MAQARRIVVSLPESLLAQVDIIVKEVRTTRSELIREAMRSYIVEQRSYHIQERMRTGYLAMASLNEAIAHDCFAADSECLDCYEQRLAEVNEG